MRVWDFHPSLLCNRHLLAQHNEIHAIHNIHTKGLTGFSHHPEVKRWKHRLGALYRTHERTAAEMLKRGMNHQSELPVLFWYLTPKPKPWQSKEEQFQVLITKQKSYFWCDCAERIIFNKGGDAIANLQKDPNLEGTRRTA